MRDKQKWNQYQRNFYNFLDVQVFAKLLLFRFKEFCKMRDKSQPQKESAQEFGETLDNLNFWDNAYFFH